MVEWVEGEKSHEYNFENADADDSFAQLWRNKTLLSQKLHFFYSFVKSTFLLFAAYLNKCE